MATRAQLISDIELRIYQGKPSDDKELDQRQIAFWIDKVRNDIVQDKLDDDLKRGMSPNPFYIEKEDCLVAVKEVTGCNDNCSEHRYYITLTNDVLPLYKDRGIIRVVDNFGRSLAHTTENFSEVLGNLPYVGTSQAKQTFYRENRNIYIRMSSDSALELYKYNVYYIRQNVEDIADDANYPIEDALVPLLMDDVERIARRQMVQGEADMDNDGADPYNFDE